MRNYKRVESLSKSDKECEQIIKSISINSDSVWHHLKFLKYFDDHPEFYHSNVVKRAINRYEFYWIPFILNNSKSISDDLEFSPPLDVHWVWYVHMLAPCKYKADLERSDLRRVIGHVASNPSSDNARFKREKTALLWRQSYPNEPFDISINDATSEQNKPIYGTAFSYDILKASERQQSFYYQVSLSHYCKKEFLEGAIWRYAKYLYLKQKYPDKFLVPCYDMDLVWHTHQANPAAYVKESTELLGKMLNHDDSDNDRTVGSKLATASQDTIKLWREHFGDEFRKSGCMHRGMNPRGQLLPLSYEDQMELMQTKTAILKLSNIKCNFLKQQPRKASLETFIELKHSSNDFPKKSKDTWKSKCLDKLKKTVLGIRTGNMWKFSHGNILEIEECSLPKIGFKLKSYESSFFCFSSSEQEKEFDLYPLYPFPTQSQTIYSRGKTRNLEIQTDFSEIKSRPTDMVFGILPGKFYDCIMPVTAQSLWGPIPLNPLPPNVDNTCRVVTHDIVNGVEDKLMSVYLVHSLPLLLSAVQVFVKGKMAVVAHTVGADSIGTMQLDEEFQGVPCRAMIIKDNKGDVGICIAAWTGVKEKKINKDRPIQPEDHGYFVMVYHNLRSGKVEKIKLPTRSGKNILEMDSLSADWDYGSILARKKDENVAQNICLAFVTSTLYLLVQPRPDNLEVAERKWNHKMSKQQDYLKPPCMRNSEMPFLNYSGWEERSRLPSNSTIVYEHRAGNKRSYDPFFFNYTDLELDFMLFMIDMTRCTVGWMNSFEMVDFSNVGGYIGGGVGLPEGGVGLPEGGDGGGDGGLDLNCFGDGGCDGGFDCSGDIGCGGCGCCF